MEKRKRVRELGLTIGVFPPGKCNSITDVAGVRVGHKTLVWGDPAHPSRRGIARTGVTVILPNEEIYNQRLFAGSSIINGAGEMTGLIQIEEWGLLETPIALTSSMNVGIVSDGIAEYMVQEYRAVREKGHVILPVVGECNDGTMNDPTRRFVKQHHVLEALRDAREGPVEEGAVGGGTGMVCCQFKGGIGTSSRVVDRGYTVGVLVMSNFGERKDLLIKGIPVGKFLAQSEPETGRSEGSIIIVIATDAPLLPHQLDRLAKRSLIGLGRVGSYAENGSGEITIAFSTANRFPQVDPLKISRKKEAQFRSIQMLKNEALNPLFEATVECVEEAILNSLFRSRTLEGRKGMIPGLPLEQVVDILRRYNPLSGKLENYQSSSFSSST
ncbi:MAG TPA: P1 family peptidase [Thermotogota bacterium]|nr:P1 family peptidase [Thermotogota bacterium]